MVLTTVDAPRERNLLLAALPSDTMRRLRPKLNCVSLVPQRVLFAAGAQVTDVYFPESGWASLLITLEDGQQSEVCSVGCEGFIGLPLLYGVETGFSETTVVGGGTALRMPAKAFLEELHSNVPLRLQLLHYAERAFSQTMQLTACNAAHDLERRLIRWILMAHDRTDQRELSVTQELLASLLCSHRPSITLAAQSLRRANLIDYRPGKITVIDREGLEAASCECYAAITKRAYARPSGLQASSSWCG